MRAKVEACEVDVQVSGEKVVAEWGLENRRVPRPPRTHQDGHEQRAKVELSVLA